MSAPSVLTRVEAPNAGRGELRITTWSAEDVDDIGGYWERNRRHLSPTQPRREEGFWTVDGQRERVARASNDVATGRMYPFVVREDGRLVAEVTLSNVVRGAFCSCHVGYSVDASRLRRGIATWAVNAAVDIAFADLGLHRLQAATLVDNAASQGVLQRCGFDRIGVAQGYLAIAGAWEDHVLWQRLNNEMAPSQPR